jgi:hypothetical protein
MRRTGYDSSRVNAQLILGCWTHLKLTGQPIPEKNFVCWRTIHAIRCTNIQSLAYAEAHQATQALTVSSTGRNSVWMWRLRLYGKGGGCGGSRLRNWIVMHGFAVWRGLAPHTWRRCIEPKANQGSGCFGKAALDQLRPEERIGFQCAPIPVRHGATAVPALKVILQSRFLSQGRHAIRAMGKGSSQTNQGLGSAFHSPA